MSIEEMHRIVSENEELADFVGEMPESKIVEAEKRLEVAFPKSYREFLRKYGCGDIDGEEFYGIGPREPNCAPSVIFMTESTREDVNLPHELIPVWYSGGEEECMIDISQSDGEEAPIISWIPGKDDAEQDRTPLFPSFSVFFVAQVKNALAIE